MTVTLLTSSPLEVADLAIGKCWDKESKGVGHMLERIERVGNKNKHASTLEHISYTFDVDGISRACLQELARHRMQSLSVKSTRYTLKELKDTHDEELYKFAVTTGDVDVDDAVVETLKDVKALLNMGKSNDIVKFALPEAYKTSLVSTMNMRGLQNFLQLRTSRAALWEIRDLAYCMYDCIPDSHKFMFKDFITPQEPKGQLTFDFEEA